MVNGVQVAYANYVGALQNKLEGGMIESYLG